MVISHKFRIFIGRLVRATPNHRMEAASSVQQKDKMADRTTRRLCVSHSFSMAPTSAERGRVISGHLANRFGSRLGTNSKLLHGVNIKPISTPIQYTKSIFFLVFTFDPHAERELSKYSIRKSILACAGAAETMPSHDPQGKGFDPLQFSLCVWTESKYKKEYTLCISSR